MAHQCRPPIANGYVVGSKSTIGLIRGEILWVGTISSSDRGRRARVGSILGVVAIACGGIPIEVTELSPAYSWFSLSHSFILVFFYTRFHKGGNRICIATSRM